MKLGIIRNFNEEGFKYTKEHGLDFIEVCTNFDNETQSFIEEADSIKKFIDKYEIPILSVGRWNSKPIKDGKIDCEVKDMIKAQIDKVSYIGCPVFNLGVNRDEGISLFQNYVIAVEYLKDIVSYAKERNVTPALYNCSWENFLNTDASWNIILPELPELMIKYDCSHVYYRGDDYLYELNKWASRIAHMHVKGAMALDGQRVDDPPAGLDALPWTQIFAVLYARGFDGTMSIEPHSSVWNDKLGETGINYTIDFARKLMLR